MTEGDDSYGDDSSIPLSAVVDAVISGKGGGLVSQDLARDNNEAPADEINGQDNKDLEVHMTVSKEASNLVVSSVQPLAEGEERRQKSLTSGTQ